MTKVVVQNGNVDLALKKFKAKFARSGVPSELKKRKCYEKPGVKRRNEKKVCESAGLRICSSIDGNRPGSLQQRQQGDDEGQ